MAHILAAKYLKEAGFLGDPNVDTKILGLGFRVNLHYRGPPKGTPNLGNSPYRAV